MVKSFKEDFFLGAKGIFAKWSIIKDIKCQCDLYFHSHYTAHAHTKFLEVQNKGEV